MATEINLVSGYRGQPHVTAAEDRNLYKGIFGGPFVLGNRPEPFKCVKQGTNSFVLNPGDAIMADGGYVSTVGITPNVVVEIPAPATASTFIIGIFRSVSDSGTESASIDVLKGGSSDPAYDEDTFMPLYRVMYQGGNFSDPEQMFTVTGGIAGNADFIVEEHIASSSTEWSWVKYDSGLAKCWRSVEFGVKGTHSVKTAMGALYRSAEVNVIGVEPPYPFEFVEKPVVNASMGNGANWGWVMPQGDSEDKRGDNTKPGGWFIVRATPKDSVSGTIDIYAIGRWK